MIVYLIVENEENFRRISNKWYFFIWSSFTIAVSRTMVFQIIKIWGIFYVFLAERERKK